MVQAREFYKLLKAHFTGLPDQEHSDIVKKLPDFGEPIGGAKKDACRSAHGLEELTSEELEKRACRERLWSRMECLRLAVDGIPLDLAFRIFLLWRRIPQRIVVRGRNWQWRFSFDLDARRRAFIVAVGRLRKAALALRSWEDLPQLEAAYESLDIEQRRALDMIPAGDNALPIRCFFRREPVCSFADDFDEKEAFESAENNGWPQETKRHARRVRRSLSMKQAQTIHGESGGILPSAPLPDLIGTFGFRGVEFGHWVTAQEQICFLHLAGRAFTDLAGVLGIPVGAISLQNTLALAFGARGNGGKIAAHFEREHRVINLTRTVGDGSPAHEWWHAFDDHLARLHGSGDLPASADGTSSARPILLIREILARLLYRAGTNEPSEFLLHAQKKDARRRKPYLSLPHELAARAFESGVAALLEQEGKASPFLVTLSSESALYPPARDAINFVRAVREFIRQHPELAGIQAARASH